MRVKTRDLKGAALDWAVELIERDYVCDSVTGSDTPVLLGIIRKFSSEWEHGGPILPRENITVARHGARFLATSQSSGASVGAADYLTAAMRCHVWAAVGSEIDVPGELV